MEKEMVSKEQAESDIDDIVNGAYCSFHWDIPSQSWTDITLDGSFSMVTLLRIVEYFMTHECLVYYIDGKLLE